VDFRLIYEGALHVASSKGGTRSEEKHAIRRAVHKQLASLWKMIPQLAARTVEHSILSAPPQERVTLGYRTTMAAAIAQPSLVEILGNQFNRCGYKFVPLVSEHLKLSCGLDITFLRRDMPGVLLVHSGGDIDNRIKVLLDALQMPSDCSQLTDQIKQPDENPYFYVLMEDDKFITDLAVTTDTLLTPCPSGAESDVHSVIKVRVRPTDFSFENLAFAI
jgi:hypothetical protein